LYYWFFGFVNYKYIRNIVFTLLCLMTKGQKSGCSLKGLLKKKVIYTSKMSKLFVYKNLSAGMVDSEYYPEYLPKLYVGGMSTILLLIFI
jgi:hypothetical protein